MYGFPTNIPAFSNRETFTQLVRVADDDTGDLVNMSGIIGSGGGFTASAWNVSVGSVQTTSASQIVIPAFPYGNDLTALTLTVPPGLAINIGDPISIEDLANVNHLLGYVTSYNATTGQIIAQIGCTFQWEVRRIGEWDANFNNGYVPFGTPGVGTLDRTAPVLTASLDNGKILFVEPDTVQIQIPEAETRGVTFATYQVGMTVSDSQVTRQLFIATLPMLFGGVTR